MNVAIEDVVLRQLARLSQTELLGLTVGALIAKREPVEAIACITQLLSTLSEVLNTAGKIEIVEKIRNIADAVERPIILRKIEESRN